MFGVAVPSLRPDLEDQRAAGRAADPATGDLVGHQLARVGDDAPVVLPGEEGGLGRTDRNPLADDQLLEGQSQDLSHLGA